MMNLPQQNSNTRTTSRQTRTAVASEGGFQFEIKVAALIGTRGLQRGDEFKLSSNIENAGNFDDLIYTARGRRYFVQLKHSDEPDIKQLKKKELVGLLHKCFKSYCGIKRDNGFRDIPIDKTEFILYTNRELGYELSQHRTQQANVDIFFATGEKKPFSFIPDRNRRNGIYALLRKSVQGSGDLDLITLISEFLKKLIIVTGQKGHRKLDDLIAEEIMNHDAVKVEPKDYNSVLHHFKTSLETWWRNTKKEDMTPESVTTWLQRAKTEHYEPFFRSLKKPVTTEIEFSDSEISRLQAELSNKRAVHLRSDALTLCSTLLLDCLDTSKRIFVTFECLQSHENMLLHAWVGGHWERLIVSCDSAVQQSDISHTCLKISEIIKQAPLNKRIIILTEQSVQLLKGFDPIEHKFSFEQLSKESQETVLDKEIDFQGCEVTMRSVLQRHGNVQHVLGPELVTDLATEGTAVNIGGKLHVNTGYYAPRILKMKARLHAHVLQNLNINGDVSAVSGMTREELLEIVPSCEIVEDFSMCKKVNQIHEETMGGRFILLSIEDTKTRVSKLCKKYVNDKLHFLKYIREDRNFLWKMSIGGTESLVDYVDAEKTRVDRGIITQCMKNGGINEESIWDSGDRTVLVVAEPGMGKTSTTTQVARHTKERYPTSWVVRINWNDHTRKLQDITAATFNLDTLVEFLLSAAFPDGKYTDFKRSLLKQALQSSGNVTVLMDGFDEISPTHADKAAVILSELMKTNVRRLWVTSRPVEKERLQMELSVIAYGMKNLSRTSQEDMLITIWKPKTGEEEIKNIKLLGFIEDLLRDLNDLFYEDNFTGCPLYISMIATVYETDVENLLKSEVWFWPEIDLVNLYERFVERKLHIYLTEKLKADITISSVVDILELLKQTYLTDFETCALAAILPPPMLESLHNKKAEEEIQSFLDKVQAGKDKTGVVMNVVEGKPQFVHRTFAEYFTARWFSKNFQTNRSVLEHILFDPNYRFVRDMFDRILAKDCPLHCAVLEWHKEHVRSILEAGCDVSAVDKGGRTVMHLSAARMLTDGYFGIDMADITYLLCHYDVPMNTTDRVMQWTPLQYAMKAGGCCTADGSLESIVQRCGLDMIRQRAHDPDYIGPVIMDAVMAGHFLLLEFIHNIGVNIHQASSSDFLSPLHAAIEEEALPVVRWLIQHGADCNTRYSDRQTPLFYAVTESSVDVVRALVEEGGASLDERDDYGRTAIDWAKVYTSNSTNPDTSVSRRQLEQMKEIVKYLRERGCKESSAVRQNNDS
jgi:hypothetical protein